MPQLTLNKVPKPISAIVEPVKVDVPEFGNNMFVYVRPLTLFEYRQLFNQAWEWDPDLIQEDANGKAPIRPARDYDEATLVAAWCTITKDGVLVFGANTAEAWRRVSGLSPKYRLAISRIHQKVLDISALREGQMNNAFGPGADETTEADAVESAGKD